MATKRGDNRGGKKPPSPRPRSGKANLPKAREVKKRQVGVREGHGKRSARLGSVDLLRGKTSRKTGQGLPRKFPSKVQVKRHSRLPYRDALGRFTSKPVRRHPLRPPPHPSLHRPKLKRPVKPPRKTHPPSPRKKPRKLPPPLPRKKPRKLPPPLPRRKPRKLPPPLPRRKPRKLPPPLPRRKPKRPKRPRKPRRKRRLPEDSVKADTAIFAHLSLIESAISSIRSEISVSIKTFINQDGTVDGELRFDLPEEYRDSEGWVLLKEFLSEVMNIAGPLVAPELGGAFWIAFGVRFGPSSEAEMGELAEMYKRFRGLFQIATYATEAWLLGSIINNVDNLVHIIELLVVKRGLPPSAIFVRFTWTPKGERPARYEHEGGGGR